MRPGISIAIETSCREGGLALGRDGRLARTVRMDASFRHTTQLLVRLDELLRGEGIAPGDLDELYVSAGPGSFTGVRVAVTVARTMAQLLPRLRCVAVPTARAVAENLRDAAWDHLAVILDAREGLIHAERFDRREGRIRPAVPPRLCWPGEFLADAPRPLLLTGEGLDYHDLSAPGVTLADAGVRLPTPEGVWRVGSELAEMGHFTDYHQLLPVYTRAPEAIRMWEKQHGKG